MLKKSTLWLCLLLISVLAMPAWSLPKSMIMTMQVSSNQGSRPVKVDAKLWYANSKFRAEVSSNTNMSTSSAVRISNRATFIMDLKSMVAFMIDESTKTAIKVDQAQMQKMTGSSGTGSRAFTDPMSMTDPAKIKAEIKRQGGKEVGHATLIGHPCTIWQMTTAQKVPVGQGKMETQNVTAKVWLADDLGIPLRFEARTDKLGAIATMNVSSVQVNVPLSGSLFGVPAGYKIQNLSDMYKAPR
ncbi:MAG: hypothetical protein ACAI44_27570 [Candidatus Sericytochromatia bacterium]